MAREFPIHNGRMTTDLDANGHKIKNLPPGSGFTQVQSDWGQTDTTAPDYIKNKPTIPAPVTIDPALSTTSENPVQNKAVAAALAAKLDGAAAYPAWEDDKTYAPDVIVSHNGKLWKNFAFDNTEEPSAEASEWVEVSLDDLKQDALSSAQLAAVNSGATAAKVSAWDGYAAQIAAKANAADVATALAQKASLTDLPYRLVEPGEWEFSGGSAGQGYYIIISSASQGGYNYDLYLAADDTFLTEENKPTDDVLSVFFEAAEITATRASLPGHLLDRANNLIDATTGNVELTLPPFVAGKVRDLLVACTIGLDTNDEPWSVIFQGQGSEAPSGADEISFKAEGDDAASATFPVPDAAGDWWYSLTERAPHVFAVSLKQLQSVSQTQGGS